MKEMKSLDFAFLKFPNFPDSKQKEIVNLYYKSLEKNKNLNIENYLELRKSKQIQVLNPPIIDNKSTEIYRINGELVLISRYISEFHGYKTKDVDPKEVKNLQKSEIRDNYYDRKRIH